MSGFVSGPATIRIGNGTFPAAHVEIRYGQPGPVATPRQFTYSGEMTITDRPLFNAIFGVTERTPMTIPSSLPREGWCWADDNGLRFTVDGAIGTRNKVVSWDTLYEDLESQRKQPADVEPEEAPTVAPAPLGKIIRFPRVDDVWQLNSNPEIEVEILIAEGGRVAYRHPDAGLLATDHLPFMGSYTLKPLSFEGTIYSLVTTGGNAINRTTISTATSMLGKGLEGKRVQITVLDQ